MVDCIFSSIVPLIDHPILLTFSVENIDFITTLNPFFSSASGTSITTFLPPMAAIVSANSRILIFDAASAMLYAWPFSPYKRI